MSTPRRIFVVVSILVFAVATGLYIVLDPATATFLLFAVVMVSLCAAGGPLLGAYTRNKDLARRRELDEATPIDAPRRPDPDHP
jgi:hypothetical protein